MRTLGDFGKPDLSADDTDARRWISEEDQAREDPVKNVIVAGIQQGEADILTGRVYTHEQAKVMLGKWFG